MKAVSAARVGLPELWIEVTWIEVRRSCSSFAWCVYDFGILLLKVKFFHKTYGSTHALPGPSFPCHKMLMLLSYALQPKTIIDFFSIIFNISFN